jgi:hypothetical protein
MEEDRRWKRIEDGRGSKTERGSKLVWKRIEFEVSRIGKKKEQGNNKEEQV